MNTCLVLQATDVMSSLGFDRPLEGGAYSQDSYRTCYFNMVVSKLVHPILQVWQLLQVSWYVDVNSQDNTYHSSRPRLGCVANISPTSMVCDQTLIGVDSFYIKGCAKYIDQ